MAYEYYTLLGVDKSASADELKKAYRKKAMELHPDRHGGDKTKEEEFKKINEAYAVLSDPAKRSQYDQMGGNPNFGNAGFGGGNPFGEGFDFGDIFESFFSGGGGFSSGGGRPRKEIGEDIELELSISFEETIRGGKQTISFERMEPCEVCHGSGAENPNDVVTCSDCNGNGRVKHRTQTMFGMMEQIISCPTCHGTGKTIKNPCKNCKGKRYERKLVSKDIDIPQGIEDGMTIKIRNEGNSWKDGNGDLFIHFSAPYKDGNLRREDNNLFYTLVLTPAEMALGGEHEIEIPILGKKKVNVKHGSQHGDTITFHKEGLPSIPGGHKGNLVIILQVHIPTKLSSREKELYTELLGEWNTKKEGGIFGGLF